MHSMLQCVITSCCRLRKGEESSENYQDNYSGFYVFFKPLVYTLFWMVFSKSYRRPVLCAKFIKRNSKKLQNAFIDLTHRVSPEGGRLSPRVEVAV